MSRQVIEKIKTSLAENLELARKGEIIPSTSTHLLLAVSGGRDSMVLLDACWRWASELGVVLSVAHLNHNLRQASEQDACFVQGQAEKRNIAFYLHAVQPPESGVNIEAWARNARYAYFEQLRQSICADAICTAHHLEDQAETLIMRLCSGRLVSSSNCIELLSAERKLVRPLLSVSHDVVTAYAEANSVQYVEDESNSSGEFLRNRVRHEVIPVLKEVFSKSLPSVLVQTLSRLQEDEAALEKLGQDEKTCDLLPEWRKLQLLAEQQIQERAHCIGYADYKRIISCREISASRERVVELGSKLICKIFTDGRLSFESRDMGLPSELETELSQFRDFPQKILWEERTLELSAKEVLGEVSIEQMKKTLDEKSVENKPALMQTYVVLPKGRLVEELGFGVRFRLEGDKVELASGQQRSLKKVLQDNSVPLEKRWQLPIVVLGDEILWIPGVERFAPASLPEAEIVDKSMLESIRIIELVCERLP